jgi:hypothetical protein
VIRLENGRRYTETCRGRIRIKTAYYAFVGFILLNNHMHGNEQHKNREQWYGSCEKGNGILGSAKGGAFFGHLSDCKFLEGSVSLSELLLRLAQPFP